MAGIAAGNANSSRSQVFRFFSWRRPEANLINLRVLDAKGVGTDSGVIAAIDKAISLKGKYNIRVMNLSLGRPVFENYTKDPLCQAVERAWKAGIVVVVAAGNEGRNNSTRHFRLCDDYFPRQRSASDHGWRDENGEHRQSRR